MPKFVLMFHGGVTPEEPSSEVMDRWMAWFGELGEAVVDMGAPFGATATIASDGTPSEGTGPDPAWISAPIPMSAATNTSQPTTRLMRHLRRDCTPAPAPVSESRIATDWGCIPRRSRLSSAKPVPEKCFRWFEYCSRSLFIVTRLRTAIHG